MYREIQLLSRDDRGVQGVAHTGCVQWLTRDDRECTGDARECIGDARENTGVDKEKLVYIHSELLGSSSHHV